LCVKGIASIGSPQPAAAVTRDKPLQKETPSSMSSFKLFFHLGPKIKKDHRLFRRTTMLPSFAFIARKRLLISSCWKTVHRFSLFPTYIFSAVSGNKLQYVFAKTNRHRTKPHRPFLTGDMLFNVNNSGSPWTRTNQKKPCPSSFSKISTYTKKAS